MTAPLSLVPSSNLTTLPSDVPKYISSSNIPKQIAFIPVNWHGAPEIVLNTYWWLVVDDCIILKINIVDFGYKIGCHPNMSP